MQTSRWRLPWTIAMLLAAAIFSPAKGSEKVAIRTADGRFLGAGPDGSVAAGRVVPGPAETFDRIVLDDGAFALRAHHGRLLPEPVSAAQNVEIFRVTPVPEENREELSRIITELLADELAGAEYDKTRRKSSQKYIKLPAPTLRDLGRMKKHRVLSVTREQRVVARLDGPLQVNILELPYLVSRTQKGHKVLMFVVEASVPVSGLVNYKIPRRVSGTTKYRAVASVAMAGEIRARHDSALLALEPPELVDIRVDLRLLDLSNDVLNTFRGEIEDLLNRELDKRNERLRQQANDAIARAIQTREFRHPLLKFLQRR